MNLYSGKTKKTFNDISITLPIIISFHHYDRRYTVEDSENELSIGSFRKTPHSRRSWQNTCLGSEGLTQKGAAWFHPGNGPRLDKTEILKQIM